jgi:hypothetical protein
MAILEGPEHRITFANAACMRLVGDREVVGRSVSNALPEAAAEGYLELWIVSSAAARAHDPA